MSSLGDVPQARPFPATVAEVLDPMRVVINRGTKDLVKLGKRFLIYGIGPEIEDPETGKPLGRVELVRGTGVVIHAQEQMATIESDRTDPPQRRVIKTYLSVLGPQEETVYSSSSRNPFDAPATGDLAKPI